MFLNMQSCHTSTGKKENEIHMHLSESLYIFITSQYISWGFDFSFSSYLPNSTSKIFCHLSLYHSICKPSALVSCHQHRTILKPNSQCQAASYTFHFDLRKLASGLLRFRTWFFKLVAPVLGTSAGNTVLAIDLSSPTAD